MHTYPLSWTTVWAVSETAVFVAGTPWLNGANIKDARAAWEKMATMNSLNVVPVFQVADFEDAPGATTTIGGYQSTDDVFRPTGWTDVGTQMNGKQLIRFGWLVKNAAGQTSTLNLARVGGTIQVVDKA